MKKFLTIMFMLTVTSISCWSQTAIADKNVLIASSFVVSEIAPAGLSSGSPTDQVELTANASAVEFKFFEKDYYLSNLGKAVDSTAPGLPLSWGAHTVRSLGGDRLSRAQIEGLCIYDQTHDTYCLYIFGPGTTADPAFYKPKQWGVPATATNLAGAGTDNYVFIGASSSGIGESWQYCPDNSVAINGTWYNRAHTISLANNCTVLSVELLTFDAKLKDKSIELTWSTKNEKNNKHFNIERSTNGVNFTNIGTVKVSGTTTTSNDYTFTDKSPISSISYYRLRQVDFDGKESLSNVISVVQTNKSKSLTVYPNPVSNVLIVETSTEDKYQIFNLLGQQVLDGKATQIDVSMLPQGTYVIKVGTEQVKFVKQ